jgi:hypothetical protein
MTRRKRRWTHPCAAYGRTGEHVHRGCYLTGVYFVQTGSDRHGWLALGRCEETTPGYEPVWGTPLHQA